MPERSLQGVSSRLGLFRNSCFVGVFLELSSSCKRMREPGRRALTAVMPHPGRSCSVTYDSNVINYIFCSHIIPLNGANVSSFKRSWSVIPYNSGSPHDELILVLIIWAKKKNKIDGPDVRLDTMKQTRKLEWKIRGNWTKKTSTVERFYGGPVDVNFQK